MAGRKTGITFSTYLPHVRFISSTLLRPKPFPFPTSQSPLLLPPLPLLTDLHHWSTYGRKSTALSALLAAAMALTMASSVEQEEGSDRREGREREWREMWSRRWRRA